jgi:putative ABC transport system permease protein
MTGDSRPPREEVDDEIRFHLERKIEALVAAGMDPDEARREAKRRFGDVEEVRMSMERETRRRRREHGVRQRLEALAQDLRYAARRLLRSPVFSGVVVLTLALGIGANTAIFSVVDHILFRPLPFPDSEQLVALWSDVTRRGGPDDEWLSYANFADVREGVPAVASGAVWGGFAPTLVLDGEARAVQGAVVSREMFPEVLMVEPALGRAFLPAEDVPDGPLVMLVSDGFWRTVLGADPGAVGRTLELNGVGREVVGVMPAGFRPPFVADADVWIPAQVDAAAQAGRRGGFSWRGVLRLTPGATVDDARAQAASLGDRLEATYPEANTDMRFTLRPLHEDVVRTASAGLWVVMAAVGLLLLVACVNVANLLLARATSRAGELSIRAAVGAGRGRIVQQLLVESLVLAVIGGGLGVALGVIGTDALVALAPDGTPRIETVAVDARVLGFSALATVLAGLLFGVLPAVRVARADLQGALREGGRQGHGGRAGTRLRNGLVAAQVALAMVVMVGAGLLLQSFQNLRTVELGYRPTGALTFFVNLPATRYGEVETRHQFVADVEARLAALPGVDAVGAVESLPLSGFDGDVTFRIEGHPLPEPGQSVAAWIRPVTVGYREAMGLRLISGRWVEPGDVRDAPRVLLVNETLAERHFPDRNPVGQRLVLGGSADAPTWEVVGVVADTRHFSIRDDRREAVYLSYQQVSPAGLFFAVRVADGRDPLALVPDMRRAVAGIDGALAPQRVRAMSEVVAEALAPDRFLTLLLTLFAAVTLFLAVVGLYGVIAYTVSARLREMGVRMALGAEAGRIGRLVVTRSLVLAVGGVVGGLVLAASGAPALRSLLYGVGAVDPPTFALAAALLLVVAALASAVPAWRATRVNPVEVLRSE